MSGVLGQGLDRVDGRLKVTGGARYAAEHPVQNVAYAVLVTSNVAKGKITSSEIAAAQAAPGVLAVYTNSNAPVFQPLPSGVWLGSGLFERFACLPNEVHFSGQMLGMVVAESFEQATYAASMVRFEIAPESAVSSLEAAVAAGRKAAELGHDKHGDVAAGLADAQVQFAATYSTPIEHHSPMEPHAATVSWQGDRITVYDTTQAVSGTRAVLAALLGIPKESVDLQSHFVGGAFGCKASVGWHVPLAAAAAKLLGRPVKVVLERPQMFSLVGHRPRTVQKVTIGSMRNGTLTAIRHEVTTQNSTGDGYTEDATGVTRVLYACPNIEVAVSKHSLDAPIPTYMRGPGETPGTFALECAMDEMAAKIGMDPVEFRAHNHAPVHPMSGKPWTSKHLIECYALGTRMIGWGRRHTDPGTRRDGDELIGYGVATAVFGGYKSGASARVRLMADDTAVGSSATHELGTGTYTVMAQLLADTLMMPFERVKFELGEGSMPEAPMSAGSMTVASVTPAIKEAAEQVLIKLMSIASSTAASPLHGVAIADLTVQDGRIYASKAPDTSYSYGEVLKKCGLPAVEMIASMSGRPDQDHECYSFGAQFADVRVNVDLGTIRVARFCNVFDIGRILNSKTAASQVKGAVIMGVGMALMEDCVMDDRYGRYVTANFADYHVPVHADVPEIETTFVEVPDPVIGGVGARGIGEIGITGVAAAIANAVYNATGKRVRDLPITIDKIL